MEGYSRCGLSGVERETVWGEQWGRHTCRSGELISTAGQRLPLGEGERERKREGE